MSSAPPPPALGWTVVYVDDVARSSELYTSAFGLVVAFEHPSGDYLEFATGDTVLALCATSLAGVSADTDLTSCGAPSGNITLVVDDVRAAFEHAVAHGARSRVEPITKPWGQESSYVVDLDDNLIELATRVVK